ncbi:MAG TPA: hypothetical protein VFO36_08845, partial [Nitrospiraceae bacterium]|nr:hypothetical protein [Nitrospiraceae bacterium]
DPRLGGLEPGRLPDGAVQGRNSFGQIGYSICPEGESETYIFAVYAVQESLSLEQGFDPLAVRKALNGISNSAGVMAASYRRR